MEFFEVFAFRTADTLMVRVSRYNRRLGLAGLDWKTSGEM